MQNKRPNSEFGVRCAQDAYGDLWVGKAGNTPFDAVFPGLKDKITKKIAEMRGSRTGAFWINPTEKVLTVVSDDSVETGEYPQAKYEA